MTAIACLKIFVGDDLQFADTEAMAGLVAKVAGAYLESVWTWPRRHGLVAPFSFVLADPRATRLDAREMRQLAVDLQHKLFGDKGAGEIALLMFEGDQSDVMRFAGTSNEALRALMAGEGEGDFAGRICKITPQGVTSLIPRDGPVEGSPPAEELEAIEPDPPKGGPSSLLGVPVATTGWWGIYYLLRERFVGSGVDCRAAWDGDPFSSVEDSDASTRDMICLNAANEALQGANAGGYMFVPFSFSSMIKPTLRETYRPLVEKLPLAARPRLAANVYDVPREPSYGAISQLRAFLQPRFSLIDLQVRDPGFRIESLPTGAVNSVTLVLTGQDERARLDLITRFLKAAEAYRAKRVWQGVAGLASLRELDLCRRLRAPFLSGPMVAPLADAPGGEVECPALNLPIRLSDHRRRQTPA